MEIKNLAAALKKFQSEMTSVKKESQNPFFKSKYADLSSIIEAVRDPLAKNGLSFTQFPTGENGLRTILLHESGEYIEDTFTIKPVDSKPQSIGSVLTYARRYALGAVLGISTEDDDDGNAASGKRHEPTQGDIAPFDEQPFYDDHQPVGKVCPKCKKPHNGKYLKCLDCWKADKQ